MTTSGQLRAAALLKALLQQEEYAELWQRRQKRARSGELNQAAIAQVIVEHLWRDGVWDDTDESLGPRRLKDRVRRALTGEDMGPKTLELFIDAFDMAPADARRLRAALNAPPSATGGAVVGTLRLPQRLPLPQLHRTVAVFEHRVIGAEGAPVTHRASRAIKAQSDTVSFYPCRQFSAASEVIILSGGRITRQHEPAGGSPILEITLNSPLSVGEVGSLEYQARFGPESSPATEYRQVAHARASNVDIVVQFHRKRLPRSIWWTIWDDYRDGTILAEHPAHLDSAGRAHRFLPYLENAAAGFRWEW
jgi:hypothetical protein